MEKEDNYTAANSAMASGLVDMADYGSASIDRPPFAGFGDVIQFADFGPRLALDHHHSNNEDMLNKTATCTEFLGASGDFNRVISASSDQVMVHVKPTNNNNNNNGKSSINNNNNSKRKRARAVKTTEEVESQRMTHIAVERNRRKQMNEHLRVLRTLMPTSYVQRGDQASIIGGAIEFVRELEQLLQCLESQKRRRLYGEGGPSSVSNQAFGGSNENEEQDQAMMAAANKIVELDNNTMNMMLIGGGVEEETAESKSSIADVEVKLLGFDAFIKILSRRRPAQLIHAISALQDLQFNILHTNITTIEQTVLYSFNVQMSSDTRFSAEDIASSVQQIFNFINASTSI